MKIEKKKNKKTSILECIEKLLNAEVHTTQELNLLVILPDLSCERPRVLERESTKLNARLALRQRADLLVANISTNRISLPQGQSYTEGKYSNGSLN